MYWGAPYPTQSACTWAQEAYHDDLFARVRAEWVDQGVPVIIGEYGVATRPNLNLPSRQYYLEYVNRAAAAQWHQDVLLGQRRAAEPDQRLRALQSKQRRGRRIKVRWMRFKRGAGVGNPEQLRTDGHEGGRRQRHRDVVAVWNQLRQYLQCELFERHVRDTDGGGGERFDIRWLEWCVHGHCEPARYP